MTTDAAKKEFINCRQRLKALARVSSRFCTSRITAGTLNVFTSGMMLSRAALLSGRGLNVDLP